MTSFPEKIQRLAISSKITKEDLVVFFNNLKKYVKSSMSEKDNIIKFTLQVINGHNRNITIKDVTNQYLNLNKRYNNGKLIEVLTPDFVKILNQAPKSQQYQSIEENIQCNKQQMITQSLNFNKQSMMSQPPNLNQQPMMQPSFGAMNMQMNRMQMQPFNKKTTQKSQIFNNFNNMQPFVFNKNPQQPQQFKPASQISQCIQQIQNYASKITSKKQKSKSNTQNETSNIQNVKSNTQNVTSNTQNTTSNIQNATSNTQNVTSNTQNTTSNTQNTTSNIQNATSNTQNTTSNAQNAKSQNSYFSLIPDSISNKEIQSKKFQSSTDLTSSTNKNHLLHFSNPQFQETNSTDPLNSMDNDENDIKTTEDDKDSHCLKYEIELYDEIKKYFKSLHNSQTENQGEKIEFDENRFEYQKEIESKFLKSLKFSSFELNKFSIRFIDKKINSITSKSSKAKATMIRKCNNIFYNTQNSNENDFFDEGNLTLPKSDINLSLYMQTVNIRNYKINDKLVTFFIGEFLEDSCFSYKIDNIEASTIVSFKLKVKNKNNDNDDDFLFCQPAFVYFNKNEKKHIINFFGIEVETNFIFPVKSIIYHRENDVNKIYIRGDIRIIEYTINGLNEYIEKVYNGSIHPVYWNKEFDEKDEIKKEMIKIVEKCTFFYEDFEYGKSVITVWENELVLGINSSLIFWKLEDLKESNHNCKIDIENIHMITSLQVINEKSLNSYLAVSSEIYPVIFILNRDHQIISRLISHTQGVTSLCSFNFALFSGSFDSTVNVWDLNKSLPTSLFHFMSDEITAIETGIFCDQLFLFTGTKNHSVICWNVTIKKILFEIHLNRNLVPKKIIFISGSNKDNGDFCKLVVLSEFDDRTIQSIFKTIQIHFFEFA